MFIMHPMRYDAQELVLHGDSKHIIGIRRHRCAERGNYAKTVPKLMKHGVVAVFGANDAIVSK